MLLFFVVVLRTCVVFVDLVDCVVNLAMVKFLRIVSCCCLLVPWHPVRTYVGAYWSWLIFLIFMPFPCSRG